MNKLTRWMNGQEGPSFKIIFFRTVKFQRTFLFLFKRNIFLDLYHVKVRFKIVV